MKNFKEYDFITFSSRYQFTAGLKVDPAVVDLACGTNGALLAR
jgi:hypothetical protein